MTDLDTALKTQTQTGAIDPFVLRWQAEQTSNPALYEQAATMLELNGYTISAARCRDRAQHYRSLIDSPECSRA